MKIYTDLSEFADEQTTHLVHAIEVLNKVLQDDIILIIERDNGSSEPAHFYFVSEKMSEKNLDINLDNYFQFGVEHVASHFRKCIEYVYDRLYDNPLLLTNEDNKQLTEALDFFVLADNQIGFGNIPDEVEQYEFSKKGMYIEARKDKKTKMKP